MKKNSIILTVFLLIGIIISCNKEEVLSTNNKNAILLDIRSNALTDTEIFELRNDFAVTLYTAMNNQPELRQFIYNKLALIKTNPDYELIYLTVKDELVFSNKTFKSILTQYADPLLLNNRGENFFDEITNLIPLMKISMPEILSIGFDSWNGTSVPSVAAVSKENDDFSLYDAQNPSGKNVSISSREQVFEYISGPVLAIMDAEIHYLINAEGYTHRGIPIKSYLPNRIDPRDAPPPPPEDDCIELLLEAMDAMEAYLVNGQEFWLIEHNLLLKMYLDCLNDLDDPDNPGAPCEEDCERDCEEKSEHLVKFRMHDNNVFYNIDNQGPLGIWETRYVFHCDVLAARLLSNGEISPHHKKIVTGALTIDDLYEYHYKWVVLPFPPFYMQWKVLDKPKWVPLSEAGGRWASDWKLYDIGTPVWYDWHEVDNGVTETNLEIKLTAKFIKKDEQEITGEATIGYNFKGDKIVELGKTYVDYCSPINTLHSTESVDFYVD